MKYIVKKRFVLNILNVKILGNFFCLIIVKVFVKVLK